MRTGGNVNGFMDLNMKLAIDRGQKPGPSIDATAPYLNGPNTFIQMRTMKGADDARRQVNYWADEGFTSFKAYMQITRAELGAAIDEAHKRGLKVTGHLCSVTYAEAADLGIDNLEHGFLAATDFVADKAADTCPGQGAGQQTIAALDETGRAVSRPRQEARRSQRGADVDADGLRDLHSRTAAAAGPRGALAVTARTVRADPRADARPIRSLSTPGSFRRPSRSSARSFAPADCSSPAPIPTGSGGVIPGYSNQRQIELLVEAGFTPLKTTRRLAGRLKNDLPGAVAGRVRLVLREPASPLGDWSNTKNEGQAMRDIRGDLQDRAGLLEEQINAHEAQFDQLIEQLKREHDSRLEDLKTELEAVNRLLELELRRVEPAPVAHSAPVREPVHHVARHAPQQAAQHAPQHTPQPVAQHAVSSRPTCGASGASCCPAAGAACGFSYPQAERGRRHVA